MQRWLSMQVKDCMTLCLRFAEWLLGATVLEGFMRFYHLFGKLVVVSNMLLAISSCQSIGIARYERPLQTCKSIRAAEERLACYDAWSETELITSNSTYLDVPQQFLDSQVRVQPDRGDYTLTVRQLLELMQSAQTAEKKSIKVLGWTRQDSIYILHAHLHQAFEVRLSYMPSAASGDNYSVLHPVNMYRKAMDASLFIIHIAAMSP